VIDSISEIICFLATSGPFNGLYTALIASQQGAAMACTRITSLFRLTIWIKTGRGEIKTKTVHILNFNGAFRLSDLGFAYKI